MAAEEEQNGVPQLRPLTAEFNKDQHNAYVELVEQAFKQTAVRNIALTGNYGTGKSSILDEVSKRRSKKTLGISLSSLGGELPSDTAPSTTTGVDSDSSLSSRVQREIVKQLLFRERPEKVRRSNYRRVGQFKWGREGVIGAAVTLALMFLLWVTGLLPRLLITPFDAPVGPIPATAANWVVYGVTFGLVAAIFTLGKWVLNPRISLTQLGAAGASVSLGKNDSTFDKNLEEIIYFFEVTDVDLVIFEDIDRFDNASIFEPLRELNTLLNGSRQIEQNVRFIYAIKDSIFEQLGQAMTSGQDARADAGDAELNRANRTKFFDWVVPVVPFITELNAKDLLATLFEQVRTEWQPSPDLLDLVAEHLTDMRLMKNIVNEYQVFASRLIATVPDITTDRLLAMIVYKNIHLGDFERITRGKSHLHTVYSASSVMKAHASQRLQVELSTVSKQIADGGTQDAHARQLGDALQDHFERIARHIHPEYAVTSSFAVAGQAFSTDDLRTPAFWAALVASPPLQVSLYWTYYGAGQGLTASIDDLRSALNDPLTPDRWAARDLRQLERKHEVLAERLTAIQHADFHQLVSNTDAHAPAAELKEQQALPPGEGLNSTDSPEVTFSAIVEHALPSKLARKLVASGYIDRYFALFVTQYYGTRVPADARLFLMQHADTGTPDTYFTFNSPDSIDAVLDARPDLLDDPTSNNIEVADRVAATGGERLTRLAARLAPLGPEDRSFMTAYLAAGKRRGPLVQAMSATSSSLPRYLLDHEQLDQPARTALLSSALAGADKDTDYDADPSLRDFIEAHYANMPTLVDPESSAATPTEGTFELLRQLDVHFSDVTQLRAELKPTVTQNSLYDFTPNNLSAVIGDDGLALDHIKESSAEVYQNVLANLPAYLGFTEVQTTIADPAELSNILNDLPVTATPAHLDSLVNRAATGATVEALSDVPPNTWPALVKFHRVPLTFDNVQRYESEHAIDEPLGTALMAAGQITELSDSEASNRLSLAVKIIDAHQSIPEVADRIKLVNSLDLEDYIDPDDLNPEDGNLLGELIEGDVIEDNEASFLRFVDSGWAAIEGALQVSEEAATFLSPSIIREEHVPALLASSKVPNSIKTTIVTELPRYAPSHQMASIAAAAQLAVELELSLPADVLAFLATHKATKPALLRLLEVALPDLDGTGLVTVLGAMPSPYPALIVPGKKKIQVPNDTLHRQLHERLHTMGYTQRFNQRPSSSQASITHP